MLWEIEQGRLAFWHKAEKCFRDNKCKPDTIGSFFEVTTSNLTSNKAYRSQERLRDETQSHLLRRLFVTSKV